MYLSALIFGLLGSVHCAVMCGPIAMVLPKGKHFLNQVSYNFGRITSYLIIGGIFGLIGKGMFLVGFQQTISVLAGVLLILIYFGSKSYSGNIAGTTFFNKILTSIRKSIGANLTVNKWYSRYLVGLVNGFLPCGLVYMAAVAAISTGSPTGGMTYMFLFGLGTVPMMAGLSISKQFFKAKQRASLYRFVPYFVVVVSTLFILRGMNLGVPYVSPKLSSENTIPSLICE
ncbi:sulfite exporter TauE/SafE family protein [Reichenbachiella sp. MALMAid0571]|uniref:sulfite exporter TauE/SafE family protein n=1 Tax=Reichenbachiella sp. MALMAid0571 TaxID=3143939 RepID=UPI0032DE8921